MIRPVETLLCVLLAATAAQAQITTSRVNVLVTGKRCSELKELYLVINGDDLEDRWVPLDRAPGTCNWTKDLGDGSISTSIARFSLRGDIARSDCQKAAANEEAVTANIEFACCVQGPLRNVSVKVEPPMPVTYTRDVKLIALALETKCDAEGIRPDKYEVEKLLDKQSVTLEIDIRESDDAPDQSTRQSVTFPAARLKPFVERWVSGNANTCD